MARYLRHAAVAALIATVAADQPTCGPGNPCPSDAPCCSAYGQCGVGAYCLGGCDPIHSFNLTSCVPNPSCVSTDYKLTSLDGVVDISKYLGDAGSANWQSSGTPLAYNNEAILLTLAPDTSGTLLASTHYVWYGRISATLTTSQGAGVVTAFIMMSDCKDEIDFEFVGVDVQHAQSNYYSQGVTVYTNEQNISASDTSTTQHTYTIDWTTDQITWSVDGNSLRTLKRSDTWNATANRYFYPQTPARIMISLWPAGISSNPQGTVEWSGGMIDWNSQYMKNGYYYAMVNDVSVECYDPPSGANIQGSKAYVYTDASATNNTIEETNNMVILKSLQANGNNPGFGAPQSSSSGSSPKSTSSAQPSSTPESIPGESGIGTVPGGGGAASNEGSGSSGSGSGSGTNSASGSASSGSSSGGSGFNQGTGSSGKSEGDKISARVGGSVFAVLVAVAVALSW